MIYESVGKRCHKCMICQCVIQPSQRSNCPRLKELCLSCRPCSRLLGPDIKRTRRRGKFSKCDVIDLSTEREKVTVFKNCEPILDLLIQSTTPKILRLFDPAQQEHVYSNVIDKNGSTKRRKSCVPKQLLQNIPKTTHSNATTISTTN